MIESGAVFAGEDKVTAFDATLDEAALDEGVILRKGKKGFCRILRG